MKLKVTFILFLSLIFFSTSFAIDDINGDGIVNVLDSTEIAPVLGNMNAGRSGDIIVATGHNEFMTVSSASTLFGNLAAFGYSSTDFSGLLTPSVLAGFDILCIGTPRVSGNDFTTAEIAAIVDFVNNGGGLMISGDYMNATINDNVKINKIASNFGIKYNQDKPNPTWPVITSFSNHPINNGVSSIGYYGWCTSNLGGTAEYIAKETSYGAVEVNEHGNGRIFSLHDWNIYSNGYIGDYHNLKFVTQGILWTDKEESLTTDTDNISESTGGSVIFYLDAGAANGGRKYLILGTLSGTAPGIPLSGGAVTLPINWDLFTNTIMSFLNTTLFYDFMDSLDVNGEAKANMNVPAVPGTGIAGMTMHFAFALGKPLNFASNPVAIKILP